MAPVLCAIFFLSGASALVFETLWFRQAGLTFGNGVWASSLVLSSYMAGLAIGNSLAARHAHRLRDAVRGYAALECVIALAGVGLVEIFPLLPGLLVPVFRPFLDAPALLNPLRFAISFALLLAPTTAMGATLPLLAKALTAADPNFGRVLGRLYGWNTLGAVVGALAGEGLLFGWLGLTRSGIAAAVGCGVAALGALGVARWQRRAAAGAGAVPAARAPEHPPAPVPLSAAGLRFLCAAFVSGALLLGLEVIWFRFLQLFVHGSSLAFAVMLAAVLAGIGAGGLAGAALLRRRPEAHGWLPVIALACGLATLIPYAQFDRVVNALFGGALDAHVRAFTRDPLETALLSLALVGPTSFLSGLFFTLLGQVLRRELDGDARAAGLLTLANTTGGMLGSLAGGFVLLRLLGMERALFGIALVYGVAALLARPVRSAAARPGAAPVWATFALLGAGFLAFPHGKMERTFVLNPSRTYIEAAGMKVMAVRESLTGTHVLLRGDFLGEPLQYRLMTDGVGMAGTHWFARRYMELFANLPLALHPGAKSALLISYGLGSTAGALVEDRDLESIDVVDVSRDVLELSALAHPEPGADPLDDSRVHAHIEDGRFFLLTTDRRYDLITGEPPPPQSAGIVNLYTREYFRLARDRLADGGILSYWLPLDTTGADGARAIIRAFCDVFDDCTLWAGTRLDWILVGTRGARAGVAESAFTRQWREPRAARRLRSIGIEVPEQLGALFLADAPGLRAETEGVDALVDDFPHRLPTRPVDMARVDRWVRELLRSEGARARFERSGFVRRHWPPDLRERTLAFFGIQDFINHTPQMLMARPATDRRAELVRVLRDTDLRSPVLWFLGSDEDKEQILRGQEDPQLPPGELAWRRGVGALASRDYARAADRFAEALQAAPGDGMLEWLRVTSLCLAGGEPGAGNRCPPERAAGAPAASTDREDPVPRLRRAGAGPRSSGSVPERGSRS